MIELDKLIKLMLVEIPKNNSESLRIYTINTSILNRLNKVNERFNDNESLLFNIINNRPSDNLNHIIKNLKESNKLISDSDHALSNLFSNLRS